MNSKLRLWKSEADNEPECNMLRITTSEHDKLLALLEAIQTNEVCDALSFESLRLETDVVKGAIQALQSREHWKFIRISQCQDQVNDLIAACFMTTMAVEHFVMESMMNANTSFLLSYGLKYSRHLQSLSISTHLTADSANILARALSQNTTVTSLSLAGCQVDESAIVPFSFALHLNKTIESLSLDGCELSDNDIAKLLRSMQYHRTMRKLSIRQNRCHKEGMAAVAALLHIDQLSELDLSYLTRPERKEVDVAPAPPPEEEKSKSPAVAEESKVVTEAVQSDETKLDDNNDSNKEESKPDKQPAPAPIPEEEEEDDDTRVQNTSLRVLQMAGNNLSDSYICSLMGIFGTRSQLEEINLFGNRITDFGVLKILKTLPKLSRLRILWLGHNQFSTDAAQFILTYVQDNYQLEQVSIMTMESDARRNEIQSLMDYYTTLNVRGRKIYAETRGSIIPASLWSHILHKVGRVSSSWSDDDGTDHEDDAYTADLIYAFLHGPVIFEHSGCVGNNNTGI